MLPLKRIEKKLIASLLIALFFLTLLNYSNISSYYFNITIQTESPGIAQLFYDTGQDFNENQSYSVYLKPGLNQYSFLLPYGFYKRLRLDPINNSDARTYISSAEITDIIGKTILEIPVTNFSPLNQIENITYPSINQAEITPQKGAIDPYLLIATPYPIKLPINFSLIFISFCFFLSVIVSTTWIWVNYFKHISKTAHDLIFANITHALFFYIVASLLISAIVFKNFIFGNNLFLYNDVGSDTSVQFWPFNFYIAENFKDSLSMWTFNVGLGSKLVYFDPFSYMGMIFGSQNIASARVYVFILKILLGGAFFLLYLREINISLYSSFIGGILYAYSGYIIINGQWDPHGSEFVAFAFTLYSIEIFIRKRNYIFLPISFLFAILIAPFNLYTFSLFSYIYLFCRCFSILVLNTRYFIRVFFEFTLLHIIGILMSAIVLIPGIYMLFDSPRVTGNYSILDSLLASIFSINDKNTLISEIFGLFHKDIMGIGNYYSGWANYLEGPGFYVGFLSLLIIGQVFHKNKNKMGYLIMILFIGSYMIFPALRYAAFGFGHVTFRFSTLWISFLILLMAVRGLDNLLEKKINFKILVANFIIIITLLVVALYTHGISVINSHHVYKILAFLFTYITVIILYQSSLINQNSFKFLLILSIIIELTVIAFPSINNRSTISRSDLARKEGYFDYTNEALYYLKEIDHGFYRTEKTYNSIYLCDSLIQNYKGVKSYYFHGKSLTMINDGLAIPRPVASASYLGNFQDRFVLNSLVSVKYMLSKNSQINMPGYEAIKSTGDVHVFKNLFALPLGFIYDQYVPKLKFMQLSPTNKDKTLLKAVVLDDTNNEAVTQYLSQFIMNDDDLNNWSLDSYIFDINKLKENSFIVSSFSNSKVMGHIDAKKDGLLFLSIPYDLGWHIAIDGMETKTYIANLGFLSVKILKGYHEITIFYRMPYIDLAIFLTIIGFLAYFLLILFAKRNRLLTLLKSA